jgi:hypothetical protein
MEPIQRNRTRKIHIRFMVAERQRIRPVATTEAPTEGLIINNSNNNKERNHVLVLKNTVVPDLVFILAPWSNRQPLKNVETKRWTRQPVRNR